MFILTKPTIFLYGSFCMGAGRFFGGQNKRVFWDFQKQAFWALPKGGGLNIVRLGPLLLGMGFPHQCEGYSSSSPLRRGSKKPVYRQINRKLII